MIDPFHHDDYDDSGMPIYEQPDLSDAPVVPITLTPRPTHDDMHMRVLWTDPAQRFPPDVLAPLSEGFQTPDERDKSIKRITDIDADVLAHHVYRLSNSLGFIVTTKIRPRLIGETTQEKALYAESIRLHWVQHALLSVAIPGHNVKGAYIDGAP